MPDHSTSSTAAKLHVCPSCDSAFADLVDGAEVAPGAWEIVLRCADCEEHRHATCSEPSLARLEDELARGLALLRLELDTFARTRFEEDAERFIAALRAGAILPMDFGVAS